MQETAFLDAPSLLGALGWVRDGFQQGKMYNRVFYIYIDLIHPFVHPSGGGTGWIGIGNIE
jgi:hypothetical protein